MPEGTPFEYLQHLVTVPVVVNGSRETRFVLDSGIGLTIFSAALSAEAGCAPTGAVYTGRRMSGQEVSVPLVSAGSLALGGFAQAELQVGVLDLSGFPPELAGIEGFVSLAFFGETAFTVDYAAQRVVVESAASLGQRAAAGTAVEVQVERDAHSVTVHLPLTLPSGRSILAEVDMGSGALILDEGLAGELGVDLDGDGVRIAEGSDETGHGYRRAFTRLSGSIHPTGAPQLAQQDTEVMFQTIIYDGLVGDSFLRNFTVTFDVAGERLILA